MLTPSTNLVIIAASTGGPQTLRAVLDGLGAIDVAVVIVQHIQATAAPLLRGSLQRISGIPVDLAADGMAIENGRIYLAPSGRHMGLKGGRVKLFDGPRVNHCIPSADVAMGSLLPGDYSHLTAVVLTGLGCDGAEGLRYLKGRGALCAAQDPATCVVANMPLAAIATGCVDLVLDPPCIRRLLAHDAARN